MRLCCMRSCAPETGEDDVGYPMVPSSTKPCGAKTMLEPPYEQRTVEKKARKESSCEQDDGNVGADGERGLPMEPRITTTPHNEEVEGPQRRMHDAASGCDRRAEGRSFEKQVGSHKRGTPPGGESVAEGHSARPKLMPKYEPVLSEDGWIYPDGRKALTARETQKRLPEKTLQRNSAKKTQEEEEFVVGKRCRRRTDEK